MCNNDENIKHSPSKNKRIKPNDETVKHPLQFEWTFWILDPTCIDKKQHKIDSFHTIEDFWGTYDQIKRPTELNLCYEYSLFKHNIQPDIQDTANKDGGLWLIELDPAEKAKIDKLWLLASLSMIGETIQYPSNDLCGLVISIRKNVIRLSFWTRTASDKNLNMEIGMKIKKHLHLDDEETELNYFKHSSNSTTTKLIQALYTL